MNELKDLSLLLDLDSDCTTPLVWYKEKLLIKKNTVVNSLKSNKKEEQLSKVIDAFFNKEIDGVYSNGIDYLEVSSLVAILRSFT